MQSLTTTVYQPVLTYAPKPSDYGIPHDTFRPHQYDGLLWCESVESVGIIAAATGSGKSVWPAALSSSRRTCCLTKTKSLQQQYDFYNSCILMGKANYPCINEENEEGATCTDCMYDSPKECHLFGSCLYPVQRRRAMAHPFPCINYAYWLASALFKSRPPDVLVLDECHLASDITLDYAGINFHSVDRATYRLPQFPSIRGAGRSSIAKALEWLKSCRFAMLDEFNRIRAKLNSDGPDKRLSRRANALQNHDYSVVATMEALRSCPEAWYIRSGPQVCTYRGKKVPGIIVRPLTARYHFPRLFLSDEWKTILMSATVGDFQTFAKELGISQKKLMTRRVPSNFPPSTRPIYILDAPKMNYKSTEGDYQKQASVIAEAIEACPREWSGIIHVTRKTEAPLLKERLIGCGVSEERLWVVPQVDEYDRWLGTQRQTELWEEKKAETPNAIMLSWTHWEGFDGRDEKICIVAKTPFPSTPPGSYEFMRRKYSGSFYKQRTAWMLQQALGRTRRGREEDYDDMGGEVKGFVAIADGNYEAVKKYMDDDFVESFVT